MGQNRKVSYLNILAQNSNIYFFGSILESGEKSYCEIEKRIIEGRKVIGMLISVLWSKIF